MSTRSGNLLSLLLGLLILHSVSAIAQPTDSLTQKLRQVVVEGQRVRSYLRSSSLGTNIVDMKMMQQMPRILGNADPLHYAQMLPGVQTVSEYDAGLHIQGSDNSHNQVGINGVPLYNVSHMLGFFSVFNASHYSAMRLTKSPTAADAPNRLGGVLDMLLDERLDTLASGEISVGPMSSQGTLRIPVGSKSKLTVSARAAYLNLFYSSFMTVDSEKIRYGFSDYNVTWLYRPDDKNLLFVDGYFGGDDLGYEDMEYASDVSFKWSNLMGALHWHHDGDKFSLRQTAYFTNYETKFKLRQPNLGVRLPSSVRDFGYKAKFSVGRLTVGTDVVYHTIAPQAPSVSGMIEYSSDSIGNQHTLETSLYAAWRQPLGDVVTLETSLRSNWYKTEDNDFWSVDPNVSLSWNVSQHSQLTLAGGLKHQYMFKTGFSDVGLPTEFWHSTDRRNRPQYACHVSLMGDTYLKDRTYHLSAELYYKRLFHQVEYSGNVFDFLYSKYNLDNTLLHGNGYNYGLSLMLEKRKGALTGWVSYSFGRAWRRFSGSVHKGRFPARHERVHELNAVATYKLSKRWSVGATYVLASGTPYTQAKYIYLLNNQIITEYGEHNAERLLPYMRLDLSANYEFTMRGKRRSGINISVYNASVRENQLFYRLRVSDEKNGFAYRPFCFLLQVMPSVNYYYYF